MIVQFTDKLQFRSPNIWNLPISNFDDRWNLFNYIIGMHFGLLDHTKIRSRSTTKIDFLEIGVWKAATLLNLYEQYGNIFDYIGVDPYGHVFEDYYVGHFWKDKDEAESVYLKARTVFDKYNSTLVRSTSAEFFQSNDRMFDAIFVDGDHRYQPTLDDCRMALSRLRPGGLLIVDDYGNCFHPEVEWAVRAFIDEHRDKISRMGGHPLFFQLPGMSAPVMLMFIYFERRH